MSVLRRAAVEGGTGSVLGVGFQQELSGPNDCFRQGNFSS